MENFEVIPPKKEKQDNVYRLGDDYFVRLDEDSKGVKIDKKIANKIAFNLNLYPRFNNFPETQSGKHISNFGDSQHCMDAVLDLFGLEVPQDDTGLDDYDEYTRVVNENSKEIIGVVVYKNYKHFLETLKKIQSEAPVWVVVEHDEVEGIHHMSTFLGIDENGEGVFYEKANGGIYNPWEIISSKDFFGGNGRLKISFRKPISNL